MLEMLNMLLEVRSHKEVRRFRMPLKMARNSHSLRLPVSILEIHKPLDRDISLSIER